MSFASLLMVNLLLLAGMAAVAWLISLPLRDASIMDVFWGLGFVVVAWSSVLFAGSPLPRGWIVAMLTTVWGLRLAGYLAWRKWGQPEDHRYAAFRERFGHWFWLVSAGLVFGLQAALQWVVSLPLEAAIVSDRDLNVVDAAGILVWLVGFGCEAIGDWQLARFKANPSNRGRVCDQGLWRYTRHPNYFGDFLVWWGLYLLAAAGGGAWTIISPVVMTVLLVRISGAALLERSLSTTKPGYREYVARTSPFFPWPPRQP